MKNVLSILYVIGMAILMMLAGCSNQQEPQQEFEATFNLVMGSNTSAQVLQKNKQANVKVAGDSMVVLYRNFVEVKSEKDSTKTRIDTTYQKDVFLVKSFDGKHGKMIVSDGSVFTFVCDFDVIRLNGDPYAMDFRSPILNWMYINPPKLATQRGVPYQRPPQ